MVERLKSKLLYKIELVLIKYIPYALALICFINTTFSYFGIDLIFLSYLGYTSLLTLAFLYISSYTFKFCIYHRLSLHYILINDILNIFDEYIGIPLDDRGLYSVYVIIVFIFITIAIYEHYKRRTDKAVKKKC